MDIKHRHTGKVILTVDTDTLQGADLQYALLHGADLRGADLHGANLTGVTLQYALLHGAASVFFAGVSSDGYTFYGVQHDNCIMIKAGCRWFSSDDAISHWRSTRGDTMLGIERIAFVEFIEQVLKNRQKTA